MGYLLVAGLDEEQWQRQRQEAGAKAPISSGLIQGPEGPC
jgi:hypothetical protein